MNVRIPPVVKNLLIINILFFIIQEFLPIGGVVTSNLALHYWGSPDFHIYQFITYMFLHGGFTHLFFNMFALWMFGRYVEYDLGSKRFLIFYMVCGIGAALFNMLVMEIQFSGIRHAIAAFMNTPTPEGLSHLAATKLPVLKHLSIGSVPFSSFVDTWGTMPNSESMIAIANDSVRYAYTASMNTLTLGASGAIFGILLAFGWMHPNDKLMLVFPPIVMKAKYFVIIYGVIELLLGFFDGGGNVAHFAHVGGMLWGWLLLVIWRKRGKI